MVSFINEQDLHPSCAERIYKYALMVDINDVFAGKETVGKHQLLTKLKGKGQKWMLVGNNKGPYEYPTEQDARADLTKINRWIKQLKEGDSNG
ncbi:hypothetical protein EI372_00290 [Vibrio fluvialis]|nr:hypothetical protein [Vibrio fluvialis]